MAYIRNYPDGRPGDGGPEAVRRRNATLLAILNYLDRAERRVALPPYIATHGPWSMPDGVCVRCGHTAVSIHAREARCDG